MKCNEILAATVVWFACLSQIASAGAPTISVNNEGSFSQHAITVRPGDTFSIDITVNTAIPIFDMYDMKLLAGSLGVFTVTGGSARAPWTDGGTLPIGEVNPQSVSFAVILPDPDLFGPGKSTLITLDIVVAGDVSPGSTTLNVIDGTWTACRICPAFGFAESGPDFIVEVLEETHIPTVSQWGLLAMGLLVLAAGTLCVRRRSYRAACAQGVLDAAGR